MLFAFGNFLLILKKSLSSFEDEIINEVKETADFKHAKYPIVLLVNYVETST